MPLRENCLYQIFDCKRGETGMVLILGEVRIFTVSDVRHVVKVRSEPFPYVSERFELVYSHSAASK